MGDRRIDRPWLAASSAIHSPAPARVVLALDRRSEAFE